MNGPDLTGDDARDLQALVGTLRDATPSPTLLAGVREALVAKSALSGLSASATAAVSASPLLKMGVLMTALTAAALALHPPAHPPPTPDATGTPTPGAAGTPTRGAAGTPTSTRRLTPASRPASAARFPSRAAQTVPAPEPARAPRAGVPGHVGGSAPEPPAGAAAGASDEAPASPSGERPPSEDLAEGLRRYARAEYLPASASFHRVLEGSTDDDVANVDKARFFLAKSLFHVGLVHASAIVFDEITSAERDAPYFDDSLEWLAELAEQLPDDPTVVSAVGRYDTAQLERLDTPELRSRFDHLLYLLGRARYEDRRLREAIALFRRVSPSSEWYVPARFFEAVSHVRDRHARPAIAAFRAVVDATHRGGVKDADRYENLAWLSLGRAYYTAAHRHDADGQLEVDGRLLGAAVDAWERVDERSEYWRDALFEASWAFYLSGHDERALGRIHALRSPFFTDADQVPEADVIRAVALFSRCQLPAVEAELRRFHRRYDPLMPALRRLAHNHESPRRAYALLDRSTRGPLGFDPRVEPLARRALADRELARHLGDVRALSAEETRVSELGREPGAAPLAAWLGQELAVARALAEDTTGELVATRLRRLVDDLTDRMNEMDSIEVEVATMYRTDAPHGADEMPERIVADEEHMIWPFDGEYWPDELPYYRVSVPNRCNSR